MLGQACTTPTATHWGWASVSCSGLPRTAGSGHLFRDSCWDQISLDRTTSHSAPDSLLSYPRQGLPHPRMHISVAWPLVLWSHHSVAGQPGPCSLYQAEICLQLPPTRPALAMRATGQGTVCPLMPAPTAILRPLSQDGHSKVTVSGRERCTGGPSIPGASSGMGPEMPGAEDDGAGV